MIDYELYSRMKNLEKQQGLTPAQIARELSLDQRTVEKWLETGRFHQRKSPAGQSKLDPYKDTILRMLETHFYTSSQILARIREEGFDGGRTIVKDYVQKVRPQRSKAYLTLSFAPGECAQVDWGAHGSVAVGSTRRRLYFFVMVLCYSRMMYAEFTVSQTMEHFLSCHRNAFEFFGGVPKRIMTDNLKSAVLKRPLGREPVFNPRYLDFAGHYGFTISPCNVGKGNEKGRVENAVGYIKKNFLAGLDMPDFAALNPALMLWLNTIAGVRVHSATRLKPCDLMIKEKPFLGPLPEHPFDVATISQVPRILPVPRHPGHQSLFCPGTLRGMPPHRQNKPGSDLHLLRKHPRGAPCKKLRPQPRLRGPRPPQRTPGPAQKGPAAEDFSQVPGAL